MDMARTKNSLTAFSPWPSPIRMKMWRAPLALLLSVFSLSVHAAPKYVQYPADLYDGRVSAPDVAQGRAREFRSRLIDAAKQRINFAGHYVLTTWGAGTGCMDGAAINARNGRVHFFPQAVCFTRPDSEKLYFKKNSRLIVFSGTLGEDGPNGAHFFIISDDGFKEVGDIRQPGTIRTEADEVESPKAQIEKPDVSALLSSGYNDLCNGKVERIALEQGEFDPPAGMVPNVGAYGETDWQAWMDMDPANGPFYITCYEDEAKGLISKRELSPSEMSCYFIDGVALCGGNSSIEPSAGAVAVNGKANVKSTDTVDGKEKSPNNEEIRALSKALLFAIHRPLFNPRWEISMGIFGPVQADKMARAFYISSIKEDFIKDGVKFKLLYNADVDMFGIIRNEADGTLASGFVTGNKISQQLYKIKSSNNFFVTALATRPTVVRNLFHNFQKIDIPYEIFTIYQIHDINSIEVHEQMMRYARLLSNPMICRSTFENTINSLELVFKDKKKSSEIGPFYLTVSSFTPEKVNGSEFLAGIVSFHDVKSNRYGGYLIFDPEDKKCKMLKIILNQY